eukprot:scaffold1254_cov251-Pinguiococcus_pyrenoidosus.AAC.20
MTCGNKHERNDGERRRASASGPPAMATAARRKGGYLIKSVENRRRRLMDRRDEHQILLLGKLLDEGHDLGGTGRIQSGRRLVEEDDVRALDERKRNGQTALLTTGEP